MDKTFLSNEEIRREGLWAVRDRLGAEGLVRFLQQFERGRGNYTRDRHRWLPDGDLEEIATMIEQAKIGKEGKKPRATRAGKPSEVGPKR